ncbi:hypothetical protein GCM10010451_45510 [Streptomyces virens]|uniref:Uncharacterized protein n=1 Tax=Streptomyces virens TaxID=285572 RepID=A0ABP6PUU2_9ACTN|nr:hypothetical protein GCM10010247_12810 [Streptomyces calvus]
MGTPAPSPADRCENLPDPPSDRWETPANRRTAVLRSEVIHDTVTPAGGAGSNLVLTAPATRTGSQLHPPLLTQESPQ